MSHRSFRWTAADESPTLQAYVRFGPSYLCLGQTKAEIMADASFRNLDSSRFGTWIRLVSDPGFALFRNAGEMVSRG